MYKNNLIIAYLVLLIVVTSGCTSQESDKNQETTEDSNMESNIEQNKESSSNKDGNYFETMTDLMDRGKSMKCTYTQNVNGETANGVVYMADKNARTEITVNEGKMYAIINQGWHYSWIGGSSKGYKMTAEAAKMDEAAKEKVSGLSKEIDFKCNSWKKDTSKFKVPTDITFEDLSEMMGIMEGSDMPSQEEMEADANKAICDVCKNFPASEQAECLGGAVCD